MIRSLHDRRAANVLDLHHPAPEGIVQFGCCLVESFTPAFIVVNDHNGLARHAGNLLKRSWVISTATYRRLGG